MHYFSGELSAGLGKVLSRFVEEMVFGLSAGGSVRLTEIGRALGEGCSLHATHKRLSRNLAAEGLEEHVRKKVLELGARRIGKDTLLVIDPSDLMKKYAEKMEYLAQIRDASEKSMGRGYWLCKVVGCEVDSPEITPLAQVLWSQDAPDHMSENTEILKIVEQVHIPVIGRIHHPAHPAHRCSLFLSRGTPPVQGVQSAETANAAPLPRLSEYAVTRK